MKLTSIHSTSVISSPNPMFDYLLESSRQDDSNKLSNIGFGEEIDITEVKIHALSRTLAIDFLLILFCDVTDVCTESL